MDLTGAVFWYTNKLHKNKLYEYIVPLTPSAH